MPPVLSKPAGQPIETTVNTTTVVVPAETVDQRSDDPFNSKVPSVMIRSLASGTGSGLSGGKGVLATAEQGSGTMSAMNLGGQGSTAAAMAGNNGTGGGQGQNALNLQGQGDGEGTGKGKANGAGEAERQGVADRAAGAGSMARGNGDGDANQPRLRGLKLDPIQELAAAASEPANLLEQLSETNLLGTNLLDALALGAGVLYLLYGPQSIQSAQSGWRRWLGGRLGSKDSGTNGTAAAAGERDVLALMLMRRENGTQQILAARLGRGTMTLLAEQELQDSQNPALLTGAMQQLLSKLQPGSRDLLLLDPRLQGAANSNAAQLQGLGEQQLNFASERLEAAVAACSAAELQQLRDWLNRPSSTPPAQLAVMQVLNERTQAFEQLLPPEQARLAAMVELSLALTWSARQG